MNLEFSQKFYKDLDSISSKSVRKRLLNLIEQLETIDSILEIQNIKKLSGFKDAYRIRIGDYRIGIFLGKRTITLARILHRKEVYKYFP